MRRLSLLFLLAVAAVALLATPASAHTEMLQTTPAAGATAEAGLEAVTLGFSQNVDHRLASVTVRRDNGEVVSTGQPSRDDLALVQAVSPLEAGRYRVRWRAAAADGHVLEGTFSFRVDDGATTSAAPAQAERLSPAELLREHARGNDDHAPEYATSTAAEPAEQDDAEAADGAEGLVAAGAAQPVQPAPPSSTTALVTLLAAAVAVTTAAAVVESIRASRV